MGVEWRHWAKYYKGILIAMAIIVTLEPRIITEVLDGLSVDTRIDDWVIVEDLDTKHRAVYGYCPLDGPGGERRGTFLPLSGFPMALVPEVQRQINALRGYPDGSVKPADMINSGRTAAEQDADDEDGEDYYDDDEDEQ